MESWGPALSGVIGGVLATWLCAAWAKWVPSVCNRNDANTLLRQNRIGIVLANLVCFAGLCLAIAVYALDYFPNNDWRGFALGAGFAFSSPVLVLPLCASIAGRAPREALVAFAISQKTPMAVLHFIFVLGTVMLVAAVTSLLSI